MNNFELFLCISLLLNGTYARPDLSLGYRYHQGHSSGGGSFLQAPNPITTSYSPTASGNSYFASQPSIGQIGDSRFAFNQESSYTGGSTLNTDFSGSSQYKSGSFYQTQEGEQHQTPIVNKNFYVHTAAPDDDQQEIIRHIQIGQPQKNYRVVFINAPSSYSAKAKIIADVAPTEENTAIYVLSKKHNALDINTEVNTPAPINNKPQVFFVKYKTPEEAVHAQQTIQSQYDALGGTSEFSNEGQISVSSVVGTFDGSGGDINTSASTNENSVHNSISTPLGIHRTDINKIQQSYLPSKIK